LHPRADVNRPTFGSAVSALLVLAAMAFAHRAHAVEERWPNRTIHLVVAQTPGGPPDLIARYVAEPLARAVVAPAGTPDGIVARVNREIEAILQSEGARAWARGQGLEVTGGSPQDFARTLVADHQRWGAIIRRMDLRKE
jgi:tripartite-type tricarboxylate transporter receptor subunit TctC